MIPGEPADPTYGPIKDIIASQGGSTKPAAGGSLGSGSVYEVENGSILANTWAGTLHRRDRPFRQPDRHEAR